MLKGFDRIQRITQEIQKKIAIILHQEIKDPRINMVTVSGVKISRDLAYAQVFVTFLHTLNQKQEIDIIKNSIKVLNGNMTKYIRYLLCKSMRLRIVPELSFLYDNSLIEGIRISKLLNNVIYKDKMHSCIIKKRE